MHLLGSALLALYRGIYNVGLKFFPPNAAFNEFPVFTFSSFLFHIQTTRFAVCPFTQFALVRHQAGAVSFVALASPAQKSRTAEHQSRCVPEPRNYKSCSRCCRNCEQQEHPAIFYILCTLRATENVTFFVLFGGRHCVGAYLMKVSGRNGCFRLEGDGHGT